MMDLKYLSAFYKVATYLNFAKAAKELHIAPSAITRQIKLLEESVGHPLFIRSPQLVKLTKNGKKLYEKTQHFFRELELDVTRKVSFGCLQSVFESDIQSRFLRHPDFWQSNIDKLIINIPEYLEADLLDGVVDFIITNRKPHSVDLMAINYGVEHYQIVSKSKITKQSMEESAWVVINSTENIFYNLNISPKSRIEINSLNAGLQLILAGYAMGILPVSVKVPSSFSTKILTYKNDVEPLYLVIPKMINGDAHLNEIIRRLLPA